jgi:hypothetical protein
MATIRITNLTTSEYWLNDIYVAVPASSAAIPYVDVVRSLAELASMKGLASAVAAGSLSVSITPSAGELATDLTYVQPLGSELLPGSVTATAMATNSVGPGTFVPVAAAGIVSPVVGIYKAMTSGGASGTLDDVTIYAVNTLPYKIRILGAVANISTAGPALSTLQIRSAAAGGGTLAATIDSTGTGTVQSSSLGSGNVSVVLTPGALVGLFIRRDRSTVGEVFITARKEL